MSELDRREWKLRTQGLSANEKYLVVTNKLGECGDIKDGVILELQDHDGFGGGFVVPREAFLAMCRELPGVVEKEGQDG